MSEKLLSEPSTDSRVRGSAISPYHVVEVLGVQEVKPTKSVIDEKGALSQGHVTLSRSQEAEAVQQHSDVMGYNTL